MSKHRRHKPRGPRFKVGEQFIFHTVALMKSPAWQGLSLTERRILDRLEIELASHAGGANGNLVCTYADLVKDGARRKSIPRAIRSLARAGLLEVVRQGRPAYGDLRIPSIYRLTYLPTVADGKAVMPTHEWKQKAGGQNDTGARGQNAPGGGKKPGGETPTNHGKARGRNAVIYLDLPGGGAGVCGTVKAVQQQPSSPARGAATAPPPPILPSTGKLPWQAPAVFVGSSPDEVAALIREADGVLR